MRCGSILRVLVGALLAFAAIGCDRNPVDFDRIGRPVRFGEVRETAAWCPGFRPEWWAAIDAEYARYDAAVTEIARSEWEPIALVAAEELSQGYRWGRSNARRRWNDNLRIADLLAVEENAFCDRLAAALPAEARPFIELLRARAAFARRTAVWCESKQAVPGPLEVLAPIGRERSAAIVAEATDAYAALAIVGDRATRLRADAYVRAIDEAEPLALEVGRIDAEIAAAEAAHRASGAVEEFTVAPALTEAAAAARKALSDRWNRLFDVDRPRIDETLRGELLDRGIAFAERIGDEARRARFIESLLLSLHEGMRSEAGLEAYIRIGEAVILRTHPGDARRLGRFRTLADAARRIQRENRATLLSGSRESRRSAYARLCSNIDAMHALLVESAGEEVAKGVGSRASELEAGSRSLDGILGVLLPEPDPAVEPTPPADEPAPAAADAEGATGFDARTSALREDAYAAVLGRTFSEQALVALAERLGLDEGARTRVLARAEEEAKAAAEDVGRIVGPITAEAQRELESELAPDEKSKALRALVRRARDPIARARARDREAREGLLRHAAELAGIAAHDDRLEITRLELELDSYFAGTNGAEVAQTLSIGPDAFVNPLSIVRAMELDRDDRAVAEAVVLARGDELRAAAEDMWVGFLANADRLAQRIFLNGGELARVGDYWRPLPVGLSAIELRFAIADDLRSVLGDDAADAYLVAFRRAVVPSLDRDGPAAGLAELAEAAGLPSTPPALGESIAAALDEGRARREMALRAAFRWNSRAPAIGRAADGIEWTTMHYGAPLGALLACRALDADERALARCEALLDFEGAPAAASAALERSPAFTPRPTVRFKPFLD